MLYGQQGKNVFSSMLSEKPNAVFKMTNVWIDIEKDKN